MSIAQFFRDPNAELSGNAGAIQRSICALLLALALFGPMLDSHSAGARKYEARRIKLLEVLKTTLVSERVCLDANDCTRKQVVFVAPEADGIDVEFFGLTEPRLLAKLTRACSDAYFESNLEMTVRIRIYRISKAEQLALPLWQSGRSTEVIFRGAK